MSIQIDREKCVGCGLCMEVCPGNLLKKDAQGKAYIKCPKDCWGCTSCIKECPRNAIQFYLGADMGGQGSKLTIKEENGVNHWKVEAVDGSVQTIDVNKKDANKY